MVDPPNLRGRFPPHLEEAVAAEIRARIDRMSVGFAYGSLACGADLLFAEACLERGIELNVVLPFNMDEFKRLSVDRGGPAWMPRFERCLAKARTLTYATEGEYLGDEMLFAYGSQLAMGLALLRAQNLESLAVQLAVWDGEETGARAGTSSDIRTWTARGRPAEIIPLDHTKRGGTARPRIRWARTTARACSPAWKYGDVTRELHAIMFGDVVGFSHVPERLLPVFQKNFMGRISETLDKFGHEVLYRNSWGDAVYAIVDTPEAGRALRARNPDGAERAESPPIGLHAPARIAPGRALWADLPRPRFPHQGRDVFRRACDARGADRAGDAAGRSVRRPRPWPPRWRCRAKPRCGPNMSATRSSPRTTARSACMCCGPRRRKRARPPCAATLRPAPPPRTVAKHSRAAAIPP